MFQLGDEMTGLYRSSTASGVLLLIMHHASPARITLSVAAVWARLTRRTLVSMPKGAALNVSTAPQRSSSLISPPEIEVTSTHTRAVLVSGGPAEARNI